MDIKSPRRMEHDPDAVFIKTVHVNGNTVNIYKRRCNTQEEVDALRDETWKRIAAVAAQQWLNTGKLP